MLTHALKEWAIAVDALTRGETIMLMRKGGIQEEGGRFTIQQQQVWLYPTIEHQNPALLKPQYAARVIPTASDGPSSGVTIQSWADMTHIFQVRETETLSALWSYHIWNEQFVRDRLKWKPSQPLYVLLLRVYRLDQAHTIPHRAEYGGCRSWIELTQDWQAIASATFHPALTDEQYEEQVTTLQSILGKGSASS